MGERNTLGRGSNNRTRVEFRVATKRMKGGGSNHQPQSKESERWKEETGSIQGKPQVGKAQEYS